MKYDICVEVYQDMLHKQNTFNAGDWFYRKHRKHRKNRKAKLNHLSNRFSRSLLIECESPEYPIRLFMATAKLWVLVESKEKCKEKMPVNVKLGDGVFKYIKSKHTLPHHT